MIPQIYLQVLRKLYERLKDSNVNWVITGSLGFALQEFPLSPMILISRQTEKELMKSSASFLSL